MKTILVLASVIALARAANLDLEELRLERIHEECQVDPDTYVDNELLHNLADNLDNPQVGAHLLCESIAIGLQFPNGALNIPMIRSKIALTVRNRMQINRLVRECAVEKETAEDTAVHLFMCLDDDGVTYFHEF